MTTTATTTTTYETLILHWISGTLSAEIVSSAAPSIQRTFVCALRPTDVAALRFIQPAVLVQILRDVHSVTWPTWLLVCRWFSVLSMRDIAPLICQLADILPHEAPWALAWTILIADAMTAANTVEAYTALRRALCRLPTVAGAIVWQTFLRSEAVPSIIQASIAGSKTYIANLKAAATATTATATHWTLQLTGQTPCRQTAVLLQGDHLRFEQQQPAAFDQLTVPLFSDIATLKTLWDCFPVLSTVLIWNLDVMRVIWAATTAPSLPPSPTSPRPSTDDNLDMDMEAQFGSMDPRLAPAAAADTTTTTTTTTAATAVVETKVRDQKTSPALTKWIIDKLATAAAAAAQPTPTPTPTPSATKCELLILPSRLLARCERVFESSTAYGNMALHDYTRMLGANIFAGVSFTHSSLYTFVLMWPTDNASRSQRGTCFPLTSGPARQEQQKQVDAFCGEYARRWQLARLGGTACEPKTAEDNSELLAWLLELSFSPWRRDLRAQCSHWPMITREMIQRGEKGLLVVADVLAFYKRTVVCWAPSRATTITRPALCAEFKSGGIPPTVLDPAYWYSNSIAQLRNRNYTPPLPSSSSSSSSSSTSLTGVLQEQIATMMEPFGFIVDRTCAKSGCFPISAAAAAAVSTTTTTPPPPPPEFVAPQSTQRHLHLSAPSTCHEYFLNYFVKPGNMFDVDAYTRMCWRDVLSLPVSSSSSSATLK